MNYKKLQTNFERELLFQIITNMRSKKLPYEKAKDTARVFMPVLKSADEAEFIEKLSKLSWYYPAILEAFIITIREYEKEKVIVGLEKVRADLRGGEQYGNN